MTEKKEKTKKVSKPKAEPIAPVQTNPCWAVLIKPNGDMTQIDHKLSFKEAQTLVGDGKEAFLEKSRWTAPTKLFKMLMLGDDFQLEGTGAISFYFDQDAPMLQDPPKENVAWLFTGAPRVILGNILITRAIKGD